MSIKLHYLIGSALTSLALLAGPAKAGCHLVDCVENVRITPAQVGKRSCEDLWVLRNSIYKDAGYCFQTEKARQWFGNQGCRFASAAAVPLSDIQRHNVSVLQRLERRQRCGA
ncbi:MAG TPA: YARHG domain-containing protein [Hyphomicrobiaceae bacterium]|nr:YARHG domain-containing protein [Hyphomicrobiaceae bacterium]